ncbi:hypothetical protein C8R46DRAFT_360578 [Mycena filopes]|nr:hypothetical protein C8R46DRAFT_360578 [Mycena filopes]
MCSPRRPRRRIMGMGSLRGRRPRRMRGGRRRAGSRRRLCHRITSYRSRGGAITLSSRRLHLRSSNNISNSNSNTSSSPSCRVMRRRLARLRGMGTGVQGQMQGGSVGAGGVQQEVVGALRSPNARIELAPLRSREEDQHMDEERSPPGGHAVIQLRSGGAAGPGVGVGVGGATPRLSGGREGGKKNPLSIGSIISDEKH